LLSGISTARSSTHIRFRLKVSSVTFFISVLFRAEYIPPPPHMLREWNVGLLMVISFITLHGWFDFKVSYHKIIFFMKMWVEVVFSVVLHSKQKVISRKCCFLRKILSIIWIVSIYCILIKVLFLFVCETNA
jgi:hypothetical protein